MNTSRRLVAVLAALFFCLFWQPGLANEEAIVAVEKKLFAVEIKVGSNWDTSIAPQEQAFFADHSAHLQELRKAGHIVMGARYSDIGLLVFSAENAESVAALMDADPSMKAGTFVYKVHALKVFYPGQVGPIAQ